MQFPMIFLFLNSYFKEWVFLSLCRSPSFLTQPQDLTTQNPVTPVTFSGLRWLKNGLTGNISAYFSDYCSEYLSGDIPDYHKFSKKRKLTSVSEAIGRNNFLFILQVSTLAACTEFKVDIKLGCQKII
jgi:hypothetical protein